MAVNKVIYGGNTLVDLTGDTVTAADLADGVKATGADGNPIVGIMQKVTIDAELSTTSTNPVQNKVIKEALDGKLGKNDTAVNASKVNNLTVETAVPKNAKFTDTVYTHPSTHPASMITGLASVAKSGSYNDLKDKPAIPTVPTKVSAFINDAGYLKQHQSLDGYAKKTDVNTALADKLGINDTAAAAIKDGAGNTISTTYASKTDVSALLSTKLGITATAYAATRDGAGNNIVDTYAKKTDIPTITVDAELSDTSTNPIQNKAVKNVIDTVTASIPTKVSTLENDAGYLTQHQSLEYEKYVSYVISGAANQPASSVMQYTATGAFTLDLSSISSKLATKEATVFTTYIKSNANYTLTITNAGTIKYIGSASDVAITSAGLLLNILMMKDSSGNLTSIVQASKLS